MEKRRQAGFLDFGYLGGLGIAAIVLPLFVYGAMSTYLGIARDPTWAALQALALAAVVGYGARHEGAIGALQAAVGAGLGAAFIQFTGANIFAVVKIDLLTPLLDILWKVFLIGLGVGILTVLSLGVAAWLGVIMAIILGLLFLAGEAIGSLVEDAVEVALTSLKRNLNIGLVAALAPGLGPLVFWLPLLPSVMLLGVGVAGILGLIIGTAVVPLVGAVFGSLYGTVFGILMLIGRRIKANVLGRLVDLLSMVLVGTITPDLVKTLWTAAYAGLGTVRGASRSLYLIGVIVLSGKAKI